MPTLGEELRQRREQRGTTLAEISETTRIGARFLKAIEADSFSVLPGGIYTRNFIRAYASSVGMSEDEAIALYHQQVSGQAADLEQANLEQARAAASSRPRPPEVQAGRRPAGPRPNWSTIVIAVGIVLIVLILGISLFQRSNHPAAENPPRTPVVSPAVDATTVPPAATTQSEAPAEPPKTEPGSTSSPGLSANEPLRVRLEGATDDSSIVYRIDDVEKTTTVLVKHGESRELPPAQKQVRISTGNRIALKLKINDREATFPADTPRFKATVTISRENIQTFFP